MTEIDGCDTLLGQITHSKQEIRLRKGLSLEYTEKILIHEIIHGIFEYCQLEQDDIVIERIANCLYQILKDNNLSF